MKHLKINILGKVPVKEQIFYNMEVIMSNETNKMTQEKLAKSLTAESIELLPFLPYLLQDIWELGSSPDDMIYLIKKHMILNENTKFLDLACGKGAVSIKIAKEFNVKIKGIDIVPEFINYAHKKATDMGVASLCQFSIGNIYQAITGERDYDCVIYGAVGDVLGTPEDVILKLKDTLKTNGFIIYDDAYLKDAETKNIKFEHDYLTYQQWMSVFDKTGVKLVDRIVSGLDEENVNDENTRLISIRADELSVEYPEKRKLFDSYVQSQINECDDLENSIVGITWLLEVKK